MHAVRSAITAIAELLVALCVFQCLIIYLYKFIYSNIATTRLLVNKVVCDMISVDMRSVPDPKRHLDHRHSAARTNATSSFYFLGIRRVTEEASSSHTANPPLHDEFSLRPMTHVSARTGAISRL